MSKHTKGPWSAFIWDTSKPHKIAIGAALAEGGGDHVVYGEFKNGMDDARLIAAAPEMLKALKIVSENLRAHGNATPLLFGALVQAELAIAKAEGGDHD